MREAVWKYLLFLNKNIFISRKRKGLDDKNENIR